MPVHVSSGRTSVGSCIKSSDYYEDSRVSGWMRLHSIMSWVCKLTVLPCTLLDVQCKLTDSGETVVKSSELVFCRKFIHINKHFTIQFNRLNDCLVFYSVMVIFQQTVFIFWLTIMYMKCNLLYSSCTC